MVNRVAAAQMKPPPRQVIGVDIGGTGLKMGRFDQSGTLLGELEVPTPKPATPGAITSELVKAIAQLDPRRDADDSYPQQTCRRWMFLSPTQRVVCG